MIQLPHARPALSAWKGRESPLLPVERKLYLDAVLNAQAGLDAARVALAGVVKRLEKGAAPAGR